jgi:hypothetical protein
LGWTTSRLNSKNQEATSVGEQICEIVRYGIGSDKNLFVQNGESIAASWLRLFISYDSYRDRTKQI